ALQVADGLTSAPSATANIQMALNLDSNSANGTTFSQPMQVFDSLGGNHTVTATFTKTAANAWSYAVTLPGADTGGATPTTLASGNVTFTSSGQLVPTVGSNPPALNVTLTSGALADGAAAMNMTWQMFDANGNSLLTQAAAASAPVSSNQDGFASGSLVDFTIQGDGTVSGAFSNGQTRSLGQLAVATFADQQGIQAVGNNAYSSTVASGAPTIGVPGTGPRGTLKGGSIEQSNVDIAAQFAQLIQAQQGYEANAKAVTTFNAVTTATINMVS
ncbi:MAG: flagellar hook-basal body complex protein, partial [Terriglobales bacterium]